ncbi:serine/arginine repetitive matrix protein 1-like [Benincasa hispida]|uniref:serine/arginine repetitive matrix protein 1-like n=1 Tax=Benincasa hispida TaxID=102211 RepID=UPI0019014596|nr:serine/arginine repetitive matrix protein 1-like [Benincasa hispida]
MSSDSDSQNQSYSLGNDSSVSSFSSSSFLSSPPPSPRKSTSVPNQSKASYGDATSSQRLAASTSPSTSMKALAKSSKKPVNPPAKTSLPRAKTPQKSKSAPKPRVKTLAKTRTRPSSMAASKPYTKPAPPPFILNITLVGATHEPLPIYAHTAPSLAVHPPPPLSIEPLAIIYPVESDMSNQPSPSPILISSPGKPHSPMGTPPFTPPIPASDSPGSEHNLENLVELARCDEEEVFGAILASLNQEQEATQVMHLDPPNASLELDETERYAAMLDEEMENEEREENEGREEERRERRVGPDASQPCPSNANEGPINQREYQGKEGWRKKKKKKLHPDLRVQRVKKGTTLWKMIGRKCAARQGRRKNNLQKELDNELIELAKEAREHAAGKCGNGGVT